MSGQPIPSSISMAAAYLTDEQALEKLVTPIPNNQQLKEALKPGFAGDVNIYHAGTRTARYVRADGKLAVCFILTEVSQQEAQAIGAKDVAIVGSDPPKHHTETATGVVHHGMAHRRRPGPRRRHHPGRVRADPSIAAAVAADGVGPASP